MNPRHSPILGPREVLHVLATYWRRLLITAAVVAGAAAVYALVMSPSWQASQALILRNEAANSEAGPGKFTRTEDMKTVQETILELAKSRGVLSGALTEVGLPANSTKEAWPTDRDIDNLRQVVKVSPPKGAEFGATEVFYLEVRDQDRGRAIQLNRTICEQLQARFQQLRDAKAESMIEELEKAVHLAGADLDAATARLTEIEKEVGTDLSELRMLQESSSGESMIRRTVTEVENELRQTRAAEQASKQLLVLLKTAQDDPGRLLATPNRLLESVPALRRLKEGLVDAQIRTATLQGRMSASHPLVQTAKDAEDEIGRHLHGELAIALRGVESDLTYSTTRAAVLEKQLTDARRRLGRLAELRATYVNRVNDTNHRAKLVERAEQSLAEARATHASAKAAHLLSRIDDADTGVRPVGPSRAMIVLAGILGGLIAGAGVVFLTAQPEHSPLAALAALTPAAREFSPVAPVVATALFVEPSLPVFQHRNNLSLRQALEKITCGNGA